MDPSALLFVYCIFIFAAANAGGRLSDLLHLTHLRTQLLMSSVAGLMLGIALLHLMPHAGEILGSLSKTGMGTLLGLISMFLLIRLFHTHDHEHDLHCLEGPCEHEKEGHDCQGDHDHDHSHDHEHSHDLEQSHESTAAVETPVKKSKRFGWAGVFFGLALHTMIDGVALASSVIADSAHGSWLGLAGIGTFLVIVLHIPLDSFAITSVMSRQGWTRNAQRFASVMFALACPFGACLFYFGVMRLFDGTELLGWGLAVSAGFFICIALADLLPEVAFHDHDRGKLTSALLFGVLIAIAIENLPGHSHDQNHPEHKHDFWPGE